MTLRTMFHEKSIQAKMSYVKLTLPRWPVTFVTAIVILTLLPCSSSIALPSGDPAPGRSPGPPPEIEAQTDNVKLTEETATFNPDIESYDETTTNNEAVDLTTEVSEVGSASGAVSNACAYARVTSDDDVVTLGGAESDVNLTLAHPVFDTEELVRGVVYEVTLEWDDASLRDYVLCSVVDNQVHGNFTPTDFQERPCRDQEVLPYFVPKHAARNKKRSREGSKFESLEDVDYRTFETSLVDYDYRTGVYSDYYFKPRYRSARSVGFRGRKSLRFGRNFVPARIVSGPLGVRRRVALQWSVSESLHADSEEITVAFRLRYRRSTSATVYQVFFTKILRLDCAIHIRAARVGRVHSGYLPRAHGCRLLIPPPSPKHALLFELHKLNVPCATGFIRSAPNTQTLCGKLEQIPATSRRWLYHSGAKSVIELHGKPMFAANFHLVDQCHDVLLTERNGSFEIGPTDRLFCSYTIHLPYGSRVAIRLQMGTGPMVNKEVATKVIHEDAHPFLCKGMSLVLEDGESKWRHCSQQGDPLRSVQIVSEGNLVRLNISVLVKRSVGSAMWLKVWWMDKSLDEVVGRCEYGWVVAGDFCVSAFREAKKAWRQAEAECVRLGGHLAGITSERQQHIVDQLLLNTPGSGVDDVYWVGATDAVHEGEFRWSNGLPFSFAHWYPGWRKHSGQPNDDGMSGQDCVEVRREFPPRPPATATFMWNDRGCREHNYYLCERPMVDDPYTSSTVKCNETIHLTLSHPRASIASPFFPRAYPDDVTCVTTLRAPPGHILQLHFEEFNTEYETHCSYDYLEIEEIAANGTGHPTDSEWFPAEYRSHEHYSDENEVWEEPEHLLPESDSVSAGWARNSSELPSRRLCGDWSGKLKLLRVTGAALRVKFRADHSKHFAGYRARVSVPHPQSCADAKQVLFKGHCYLFAGHPKTSWATAKQVCEDLNMHLSSSHSVEEQRFIVSNIRQSSDYSAGTVYWLGARLAARSAGTNSRLEHAEASDHSHTVERAGEYLGASNGGNQGSAEEGFLWVDGSAVTYQGWPPYNDSEGWEEERCLGAQWKSSPVPSQPSGLYWVAHKCSATGGYVCKRRLSSEPIVTNQTVEGSSGALKSPNYPAVYDNDLDYWVHVEGPSGSRLVFAFDKLELEGQKDCLYDFIELRDSVNGKSSRYCGSPGTTRWVASSNKAVLHFHSDYDTQGPGFSLHWHAVEMAGCPSQTLTSKAGVIRSPNYPDFLLPNLDCTFEILAPTGKRVFLNISHFDFGYGVFENGVPHNTTTLSQDDVLLEIQVDLDGAPIRPFRNPEVLNNGLYLSEREVLRVRLKTGSNVTGRGFLAHFSSVSYLNVTQTLDLHEVRMGRLPPLNWPLVAKRALLRTLIVAQQYHTLAVAFSGTTLVSPVVGSDWPCGEGNGWIEVHDSYSDSNGTRWTLCGATRPTRNRRATPYTRATRAPRGRRKVDPGAPLVINSYLNSLTLTQHSGETGIDIDVSLVVKKDPEYRSKLLLLPDETSLESCYPNPCQHGGHCVSDDAKKFCQCSGYYTGLFCLLTACDKSPCAFGNCTLNSLRSGADGFECSCVSGYKGRRCNEKIRPCASRPCNNRGACQEKDGGFLCQCNPSWKGKRCETPNPTPRIVSLGTRMIQEPFWLGLIAVFVVLGAIGLVWCGKRHFPEKIEKLLAEEADRCARPAPVRLGATPSCEVPPHRTLLTRLGIRKASVSSTERPRAARTFSLDDLLKPPPRRTPSPRKKRNNSTPTKKNAAEKKQILQQLISPAASNDRSKKITMGELIQMSEKRTLSTVESAPAFIEYGMDNKETSFASEGSSPSTSPSMRHVSDPKLEKKVTFARLLNKVSAEMSSSSEVDMVNTIAIPMAVIGDRGIRAKASSTPPSPGVEVRSPHSTSSNQGSDSMSSLDLTLAHAALKKYSRTPKISSADSILAMFRNFSSSSAMGMASRASSGGISASSTPSASSPQDDMDCDDASIVSSLVPSLAPDSPVSRPYNTIEIQVLDPLSGHKSSALGSNLLHPPSILLEVPSGINKCLSPIRELPTPLPTPMPTPLPSPRMPRANMESDLKSESTITCASPSEDEMDEIRVESRCERPSSALRLKLRQPAISQDTPTPSTHVTDSPSPSFSHSQDSEREMSTPPTMSPAPPALGVPILTIERPSPGSPPPRRTPPHIEFQPPPVITITYNPSEESDEPLSPRPPPTAGNMCYLSPFSMTARGERAPSESNLSSSGYSSMASPGPSRCGSSNPLCPSEMEDPGSGGGPSCFQRRRPLMKTNSSPAGSNEETKERRRGRSDSETLSDDPLLESNDEGIGTDEKVDDVPSSAKEMETLVVLKELEVPQTPSGVTKCSIVRCISVERGLDEKASLKPPTLDVGRPLSPVSSRSESPISDKTGLGRFSPQFYGRPLPFTDSDGLYDFPSSDGVRGASSKTISAQRKVGKKRDRKTIRTVSHEAAAAAKPTLPHLPHSMHNLLEVPGPREASGSTPGGRKLGRRRSRSQAPATVATSSSSEDSVSAASVASVASAREFRVAPDLEMQPEPSRLRKPLKRQKCRSSEDTSSKISSSLDLTEDSRRPIKTNKLRTISNQIRFLRRLERSLKMKETYPAVTDDEGDESSSVTSPLLQGRKDLPSHAISAPLLGAARPKIARQRRYDRAFLGEETRTLNAPAGNDNSD